MKVTRIYADEEGNSCFDEINIPLIDDNKLGSISKSFDAKQILFRETPENWAFDWHPAPRRQFIIFLSGGTSEVTVSNGEKRQFPPGSILLAEDTTGQGHSSRVIDGKPIQSIYVVLD